MEKFAPKLQSVLFLVLILALAVIGQELDEEYAAYDYNNSNEPNNQVSPTTTAAPRASTTASPEAALEDRVVARIMSKLNLTLDFHIGRMQSQINKMASRRPTIFSTDGNVQANTRMIQQLQGLVLSLQNKTVNSQCYNETAASILEMSAGFQSEFQVMGYRIDTLANDLRNQNLENIQLAFTRLSRLDRLVENFERERKEESRKKVVAKLLEAFKNEENDLVKALLNDLTKENQLESSIPEIVGGMFNGSLRNYPKTLALFQSATKEQYKAGLTSLIDLFGRSSSSSSSGSSTSTSNSNSNRRSLVDEPEFLELAFFAKGEFGSELQPKFPKLVQNLVFAKKLCVRNLFTNFFLSVDRVQGLKEGGYPVITRKKSLEFPTVVLCDWEITSSDNGASFVIKRKNQTETLNLNVLDGSVFAGSDDYNPSYFWKIQLTKNAQEMTLQNVVARSEDTTYFLCSLKPLKKAGSKVKAPKPTQRQLKLSTSSENSCTWIIESPQ